MKLLLSVIGLFFCGTSFLLCMENFPRVLHQSGYTLLMEMRDRKIKDALIKIVSADSTYSAQEIYAIVERELCVVASNDVQNFTRAAVLPPVIMHDAKGGSGPNSGQTVILGNSYTFGGWAAAVAVIGSFILGYTLRAFKSSSSRKK